MNYIYRCALYIPNYMFKNIYDQLFIIKDVGFEGSKAVKQKKKKTLIGISYRIAHSYVTII